MPRMTVQDKIQPGARLGRYTVERRVEVPEIAATLYLLRHELGARHAHVARDDDNLSFGVLFPTVPQDSTGVAHILEHVALMGSRHYPVSDPFFAMIPRSLSTFMNAMTASDWTVYPFSTRNEKDFFNLLGVYLDASFFPLLREDSFRRDGHRFEFKDPADKTSELTMQGVVYNEMKGAMASAGSVLYRALGKALYPDLTYANNSGGEPKDIPGLTYENLKAFHAAHYHPSNAFFFTYGNLPLERFLEPIEAQVMSQFQPLELDVSIPDQPLFDAPRQEEVAYPSSDTAHGAQVLLAWKLGHSFDTYQNVLWNVLSDVLLGNPGAPLHRALIESGLGSALADGSGYNDSFREAAFAAGLKGLPAGQAEAVQALVLDTLRDIADDGIPDELIDSAVHQYEIAQKEVSNAGYPYGLKLMFRVLGPWLYGGDPASGLNIGAELARLASERAGGRVFEPMLQSLLENTHRVTLALNPDPELAERQAEGERQMVAELSAGFTEADRDRIVAEALRLQALQEQPDDEGALPTLSVEDIPAEVARPAYALAQEGQVTVGRVPQPTSGLVYLDVQMRLDHLTDGQLDALPLYAYALTRSGAAGEDYVALAQRIEAVSGGVSAGAGVGTGPARLDDLRPSFTLGGKALSRNAGAFVALLHDLLTAPEFTAERLSALVRQRVSGLKAAVVGNGQAFAGRLAGAQVSPAGALDERQGGLSHLHWLQGLEGERLEALPGQFKAIQSALLAAPARVCLTATPEDVSLDLSPITELFGAPTPAAPFRAELAPRVPQARTADTPVAFNVQSWQTVPYTHHDSPALMVLSRLLRSEYLLRELREKGGAYGAHASFDARDGVFTLGSYRDPHIGRTYEVYQGVADFLAGELEARVLTESILSASKSLDPLTSPDTVGRLRFFGDQAGYTPEVQEAYKAGLLAVTLDDLRRVYREHLQEGEPAYALVAGHDPNPDTERLGLRFEVQSAT